MQSADAAVVSADAQGLDARKVEPVEAHRDSASAESDPEEEENKAKEANAAAEAAQPVAGRRRWVC